MRASLSATGGYSNENRVLDLTVRELVEDYDDAGEVGVTGYGGKLDIRPPFQREFIYNDKERNAVIDSILKDFPLNVMYWADREDGTFEIIDGQQRTISVAQYVDGDFRSIINTSTISHQTNKN